MSQPTFSLKDLPSDPSALDDWLQQQEDSVPKLKNSARASIIWANPEKKKPTDFALVYLHGFKASHPEGDPIHKEVARHFGWNLFLSRLAGHGLDVDKPLLDFKPGLLERSAEEALIIGKELGKKIILMGTSTGGSLSLYLASDSQLNRSIEALILYSPLVKFYSYNHLLLGNRTGRTLLKMIPGRHYMVKSESGVSPKEKEIWYDSYAMQGALSLGKFVQETMTSSLFENIRIPTFTGYYYRNKKRQDKVVSVKAIKYMYERLGTPKPRKILKNYPKAGTHVISSGLLSKSVEEIKNDTIRFLKEQILSDIA